MELILWLCLISLDDQNHIIQRILQHIHECIQHNCSSIFLLTQQIMIMIPFINDLDTEDDRSITELTNIEIGATISFKVFEWLAIDYVFRALRQPQLLDEWQIQNNLLLTASYSFFKPEKEEKK